MCLLNNTTEYSRAVLRLVLLLFCIFFSLLSSFSFDSRFFDSKPSSVQCCELWYALLCEGNRAMVTEWNLVLLLLCTKRFVLFSVAFAVECRILNSSIIADLVFAFCIYISWVGWNKWTQARAHLCLSQMKASDTLYSFSHANTHAVFSARSKIPFSRRRKWKNRRKKTKKFGKERHFGWTIMANATTRRNNEWSSERLGNKKEACTKCKRCLPACVRHDKSNVVIIWAASHHYVDTFFFFFFFSGRSRLCQPTIYFAFFSFSSRPLLCHAKGSFFSLAFISISSVIWTNSSDEINDDLTPAIERHSLLCC